MNSLSRAVLVKFSLLLFAFWLRVYDLTGEGLWLDEASSANFVQRNFAAMLTVTANNPHPPLYYTPTQPRLWLVLLSSAPLPGDQKQLTGDVAQQWEPPQRFAGLEIYRLAPRGDTFTSP
jgi:hypothetical protein